MREFLIERGEESLPFVGSRSPRDASEAVAAEIRAALELTPGWSRELGTWEDALRLLIQRIEGLGVLVMINGVVENNTRRPLEVEEFRGFALSDPYAPLIFVNGRDAKAAQMFTLVHELAHIWIGEGGVSAIEGLLPGNNAVEVFCNQVAAEALVPRREIEDVWNRREDTIDQVNRLKRRFKVSPIVVARRALDLDLMDREEFSEFYRAYREEAARRRARAPNGGNFYLTLGTRLGKRFPAAVFSAAKEGRLAYREAYQLTGLSGRNYDQFGQTFGFAV